MSNQIITSKLLLMTAVIFASFSAYAQDNSSGSTNQQSIFPKGRKAPESNFTGTAWVYPLIEPDSVFNIPVANVTFEPGARSHWHTHGGGQALIAIDGIGYYQEKGKPVRILRKGDSVKCPPNTPHWHGASPQTGFTQIAVTPNATTGRVTWLRPVTEEEYRSLK
jgi:quercetin dioxygenase-like cupin family protein